MKQAGLEIFSFIRIRCHFSHGNIRVNFGGCVNVLDIPGVSYFFYFFRGASLYSNWRCKTLLHSSSLKWNIYSSCEWTSSAAPRNIIFHSFLHARNLDQASSIKLAEQLFHLAFLWNAYIGMPSTSDKGTILHEKINRIWIKRFCTRLHFSEK